MQSKALILSGGGAKGAYEVGVWKALEEKQISRQIKLVSGTSAGALNAALFAQGNLNEALEVWMTIQEDHILKPNDVCVASTKELAKEEKQLLCTLIRQKNICAVLKMPILNKLGAYLYKYVIAKFIHSLEASLTFQLAKALVPCFINILMQLKTNLNFEEAVVKTMYFMERMLKDGLFSQEGLQKILDEHYHGNQLLSSCVTMYATAYNISKIKKEQFKFTAFNEKHHKKILLASSAIPFVFDQIKIEDNYYIDGGIPIVGDNTPIDVAYQEGFRDFIVVVMSTKEVDTSKYKDANIIIIQPEESLGSSLASLDFDNAYTKNLIQKGYEDALKKL